jgi:hypothetical protein
MQHILGRTFHDARTPMLYRDSSKDSATGSAGFVSTRLLQLSFSRANQSGAFKVLDR